MKIKQSRSLRKIIDRHCKTCIYDPKAAGTWKQQVSLCTVTTCALYSARPVTKAPIPESVFDYYGVVEAESAFSGCSRPLDGPVTEHIATDPAVTIRAV